MWAFPTRATICWALPDAYEEARSAINVGRVYHSSRTVFVYRNLLLERFLYDVPAGYVRQLQHAMIFNRKTAQACSTMKWCTPSRASLTTV